MGLIVRQGDSSGGDDALALIISHVSYWSLLVNKEESKMIPEVPSEVEGAFLQSQILMSFKLYKNTHGLG